MHADSPTPTFFRAQPRLKECTAFAGRTGHEELPAMYVAATLMTGLVRGSKHWSFAEQHRMVASSS